MAQATLVVAGEVREQAKERDEKMQNRVEYEEELFLLQPRPIARQEIGPKKAAAARPSGFFWVRKYP